jgi:O-antigen/teichoic acid export membrane protein
LRYTGSLENPCLQKQTPETLFALSISRNILLQLITQITGVFSGFLVSIITARMLGVGGRGEFALFITSLNFLSTFFGIGLSYSILYITSSHKFNLSKTIKTALLISVILLVLCAVLFLAEHYFGFHFFFQNQTILVNMLLLFTFFHMLINGILGGVMTGKLLFRPVQVAGIIVSIINVILYASFFLYVWKSIGDGIPFKNFITFYSAAVFLPFLINLFLFYRYVKLENTPGLLGISEVKYILTYAFIAYAANVFQFFTIKMDFFLVDHFAGRNELGIYSLAVNLTRLIYLIPLGITSVMVAYNASDDLERVIKNINKLLRMTAFIVFVVCVTVLLVADIFIPFFYGSDFARSADVFKILLAGMIPLSIVQIFTSFFAGRAKLIYNLSAMVVLFACTLLFDYLLIPRWGITGASWANVIANFITCAYLVFIYRQMTSSAFSRMFYITAADLNDLKSKMLELAKSLRRRLT